MPSQGHLYMGVPVSGEDEARAVLEKLGLDLSKRRTIPEYDGVFGMVNVQKELQYYEEKLTVCIEAMSNEDGEGGIVGFPLTSRYKGAILDKAFEHGRPEPFVLDIAELAYMLVQVKRWWPEAKILLWDQTF